VRRAALPAFLLLQAAICFWNLGLLSPWMDEAGTLILERNSAGSAAMAAAHDVHPPLFYLLLWVWQRAPLGLDWAVQARTLTVLLGLAATAALDRALACRLADRQRLWFLALWCLSPCLLLYSRMCRSYSLQVLAAALGVGALLRYLDKPTARRAFWTGLALLGAIYTHYVPGLALIVVTNAALAARRRWRDAVTILAMLSAGLAPWAYWLGRSLGAWARHGDGYQVAGGAAEVAIKLGYLAISFTLGEAAPDAVLVAGAALLPVWGWMLWQGTRKWQRLARIAAGLSAIGFVGVARWVSYPFLPARMLFLLPLLLMLLVVGASRWRRAGPAALSALLALGIAGDWCYFHKAGFRNKQYPMPMREIAGMVDAGSIVLVDSTNSDPVGMRYALGESRPLMRTADADAPSQLAARLADPAVRGAWFLRNTHDVSAGALNVRLEKELRQAMPLVRVREFEAFTPLEGRMMRALGMRRPPRYFSELLEFRR